MGSLQDDVSPPRTCTAHVKHPAVVACSRCGLPLCDACWTHVHVKAPWCAACAGEVGSRSFRLWSWAVTFLAISSGATVLAWRSLVLADDHAYIVFGAIVAAGVFLFLVYRALARKDIPEISLRTIHDAIPEHPDPAAHPYRARWRHVTMRVVPRVSGRLATLLVLVCLALSAVLFPAVLRLPRWLEAEVVLVAWWVVFASVLSFLLYRGLRVADDFRLKLTSPWGGFKQREKAGSQVPGEKSGSKALDWLPSGCDPLGGCADAEGCVVVLAVGLALIAALGAAWIVAELVVPAFFFACYLLLIRALSRVANDKHDCAGRLERSIRWGMTWAALYVLPLAVAVFGIHALWKR